MIYVYEELGDASRRRLLSELRAGPKTVSDLVVATFMKQPNVSSHLARMRGKGIVRAEKVGRQVFYSFATVEVEEIVLKALTNREAACPKPCLEAAPKRYAAAAIAGDEDACCEVIDLALASQMGLLEIYQDLLAPAVVMIREWHSAGEVDTAQEGMASAITERMMARIVQKFVPVCKQDLTAVLGCGPNSWHVIVLRMVADYLNLSGWKTLFLGANIPHKCFLNVVDQHEPNLVIVGCVAEADLACGLSLIRELSTRRSAQRKFVIGVGGPCVCKNRDLFLAAGADFTCSNLRKFATEYLPSIERTGKIVSTPV
jgi:methanogenic corrinoid protein MtbC1